MKTVQNLLLMLAIFALSASASYASDTQNNSGMNLTPLSVSHYTSAEMLIDQKTSKPVSEITKSEVLDAAAGCCKEWKTVVAGSDANGNNVYVTYCNKPCPQT